MKRILLAVGLLACAPDAALAWGSDGHRIVGEIAYRRLTPEARRWVREVLPNRGRYRTLYEGATWADTYARGRDGYAHLEPLHYIDADPDADRVDVRRRCGARGCVVRAIVDNACALDRGTGDARRELEALYLLAHFVGDVHQPLHVAHPDGLGGNRTHPTFLGEALSLHQIWDTALIEHHLRRSGARADDERESGPDEYAEWDVYAGELDASLPAEAAQWKTQLDPALWANESLQAAKQHAFDVTSADRLMEEYYETAMPVIRERLQRAGVRLAGLLDAIVASGPLPYRCQERGARAVEEAGGAPTARAPIRAPQRARLTAPGRGTP